MNRVWLFLVALACPFLALAQNRGPGPSEPSSNRPPYQPAVPPPTTTVYGGGGWGGDVGGTTVAGSALQGMSQVISAAGQYNLATSAAAINMTEAQSNAMRNEIQSVNTFWEKRNIGRAQRAAERGPNPTAEQLARIAHAGAPRPMSPSQMDPVSGRLNWPDPLLDASFDPPRSQLDQIVAKWAAYGGLDYSERSQVRQAVATMFDGLKAQIREIPPQTYTASRSFLQSLLYAATKTTL